MLKCRAISSAARCVVRTLAFSSRTRTLSGFASLASLAVVSVPRARPPPDAPTIAASADRQLRGDATGCSRAGQHGRSATNVPRRLHPCTGDSLRQAGCGGTNARSACRRRPSPSQQAATTRSAASAIRPDDVPFVLKGIARTGEKALKTDVTILSLTYTPSRCFSRLLLHTVATALFQLGERRWLAPSAGRCGLRDAGRACTRATGCTHRC
jgi:hypothetical protein